MYFFYSLSLMNFSHSTFGSLIFFLRYFTKTLKWSQCLDGKRKKFNATHVVWLNRRMILLSVLDFGFSVKSFVSSSINLYVRFLLFCLFVAVLVVVIGKVYMRNSRMSIQSNRCYLEVIKINCTKMKSVGQSVSRVLHFAISLSSWNNARCKHSHSRVAYIMIFEPIHAYIQIYKDEKKKIKLEK